jgi:hypothetical protein
VTVLKSRRSPPEATGTAEPDAPIQNMLAEQAMNDYALFAICLGVILDPTASFMAKPGGPAGD